MKLSAMVTVLHNWSKYKSKSQYSPSENPKKLQFFAKKVKCAAEMSWPTDLLPQIRKVSVKKTIDLTVCPHLKRTTTESFSSSQTSTREPHSVQRSDNTDWPSSQREKTWYEWAPFTPLKLNLLLTFFFFLFLRLFQKFELLPVQLETCWHERHIESLQWQRSRSSRGQELFFPRQTCSSWA